ncbi:MAG: LCP family protein [Clostridia bacterium]|nr:LCP family protein [Clostridia bacterium]
MGIDKNKSGGKHSKGNGSTSNSRNSKIENIDNQINNKSNKVDIDKEIEYMDNYMKKNHIGESETRKENKKSDEFNDKGDFPKFEDQEVLINLRRSDSDDGAESEEPETPKKKMSRPLKIFLIILTAIIVTVAAIFGRYLFKSGGSVSEAFKSMVKDVVGDQDPIFVLVLGVSEDISVELTDTIMLIGYNPDNNKAFVLSIPRDTFIGDNENKAGGFDKINALYQKDPQKTVEAVEKLTGLKIDHYVTVKTSVLVKIVDAIGGVDFDVPIDMDYDDTSQDLHIHLKAGPQKIDGEKAEQLVRFRHNNNGSTYSPQWGDNDEGRMRTQREFLKVVANKVVQTRNVDQIKQITSALFENLVTDITVDKMIGYIPYAIDINPDEILMAQLPGDFAKFSGLWFYKADSAKTEELVKEYVDSLELTESEKSKYVIGKPKKSTTETKKESTSNSNTTKNNTNKSEETTTKTEKSSTSTTTTKTTTTNNTTKSTTNTDSSTKTKTTEKTSTSQENTSSKTDTEQSTSNSNSTTNSNSNSESQSNKSEDSSSSSTSNSNNSTGNSSQSSGSESSGSGGNNDSGSGDSVE